MQNTSNPNEHQHSEPAIVAEDLWLKFKVDFRNEPMTAPKLMMRAISSIVRTVRTLDLENISFLSDFWALRGISFQVMKGEVVGVIGPNGAGKSTLLQVLAGIFAPDKGSVNIKGRVSTLLSLGAGFNNQLTGRENIYLVGIVMGFSKSEIAEIEDAIIEFSGLGQFIDAPIKTYSHGMRARLGFSIAINIDPEVLLIDEVLQAGDLDFRKQSGSILQKFQRLDKTIVVVTHSMNLVKKSCNRAIFLEHGQVTMDGEPHEVVNAYESVYGKTHRAQSQQQMPASSV